jgi:hypothetical protein
MIVEFPYRYVTTNHFGKLYRPYAKILVRNCLNPKLWLERVAIVDSGADFTLFPRKDAYLFGVNLARDVKIDKTFGVGGSEKIFLYKNLSVKLGNKSLKIPVGFLDRNDVPALLGRQLFLDLFSVQLVKLKVKIER